MGFVDTHAHIFERGLPLAENRRYAPDYDATVEDYLGVLDRHGLSVGLLVQPSFLGVNNDYMLEALGRYPDRLRGVAVVSPDVSRETIGAMDETGVTGLRLNLDGLPLPDFSSGGWPGLLDLLRGLDWHVELHRDARDLSLLLDPLLKSGVRVVVDHFGRPTPSDPLNDAGFKYLLRAGGSGRVWVKLSAAYRIGGPETGEKAALLMAPKLLESLGPERLLWGSDWPHTRNETITSYEETLDALKTLGPERRGAPQDSRRCSGSTPGPEKNQQELKFRQARVILLPTLGK